MPAITATGSWLAQLGDDRRKGVDAPALQIFPIGQPHDIVDMDAQPFSGRSIPAGKPRCVPRMRLRETTSPFSAWSSTSTVRSGKAGRSTWLKVCSMPAMPASPPGGVAPVRCREGIWFRRMAPARSHALRRGKVGCRYVCQRRGARCLVPALECVHRHVQAVCRADAGAASFRCSIASEHLWDASRQACRRP